MSVELNMQVKKEHWLVSIIVPSYSQHYDNYILIFTFDRDIR